MIELTTLGGSSVRRDGVELSGLSTHKQKFALLAYLAIEGPIARDRLLSLFWPEREEEKARHSLSQALYALKRELGEDCIRVTGDEVGLVADAVAVDAKRLEAAADDETWQTVIDLYDGPFLDQFHLPGAREFEDWQSHTRVRLARLARRGFARVAAAREAVGDHQGALASASRWAQLEPLEDEAQHTLIALLARAGQRSEALEHFEAYRERLARELDVEPLEETVALVERIRAGEMPEFRPLAATERAKDVPQVRELPAEAYFKTSAGAPAAERARVARAARVGPTSLLEELRKRRVFHVGAAYLAVSWLAIEVAGTFTEHEVLPSAVFPALLFFLVVGLPFALILAWAQEQQAAAAAETEALPRTGPWPRWFEKVRGGHVLAFLSAMLLALLIASLSLRGGFRSESPIDAAVGFDPTRIAVLHFDDLSEEQELGPLSAGFTKALIHELSQVEALDVISFNGVNRYRDSNVTLDSIARAFRAGSLVEASVAESQGWLRVSVQLIDAASAAIIASDTFGRPRGEMFALQDDLVRRLAGFLKERLGVEIRLRARRKGTESGAAWELVQSAEQLRHEARRLRSTGATHAAGLAYDRSDSLLERAESLDPSWLEPIVLRGWVALGQAWLFAPTPGTYERESLIRGIAHVDRALELKPANPRALELRGTLRYRLWETADSTTAPGLHEGAEKDLRAAVAGDPTLANAWARLSDVLRVTGRLEEAKHTAEKALETDEFLSERLWVTFQLCQTSLDLVDVEEAIRWCGDGRERFPRQRAFMEAELVLLAGSIGPEPDVDKAWELADARELRTPPDRRHLVRPTGLMDVAAVLVRADLPDSARAVIRKGREADTQNDPWVDYKEANARLQLGESDKALHLLAEFLEAKPDRKDYIAKDWWWRPLRDDPRFKALVGAEEQPPSSP